MENRWPGIGFAKTSILGFAIEHPLHDEDWDHDGASLVCRVEVVVQPLREPDRGLPPRLLQNLWLGSLFVVIADPFLALFAVRADGPRFPDAPAPSVRSFWLPFLEADSSPILVYPDATILLDTTNDLFRFRCGAVDRRGPLVDPHLARTFASNPKEAAAAGPPYCENGYTGTGELESLPIISGLVAQLGSKLTVKPASKLTADDLTRHDLIVLGSSFQNGSTRDLAQSGHFPFVNQTNKLEAWLGQIRNASVRRGKRAVYQTERDSAGVLLCDYALVSIQPAIYGKHQSLLLGGLDSSGTTGVTLYAVSSRRIEDLAKSGVPFLGKQEKYKTPLSTFQALIRADLLNGRGAVHSQLIGHGISSRPPDPLAAK